MQALEKRIVELIQKLTPLGEVDLSKIKELVVKHGEYGIALENLCSIIEENKIAIDSNDLQEILDLFRLMEFEDTSIAYYSKALKTISQNP